MKEENPIRTAHELARAGRLNDAVALLEAVLARARSNASRPTDTPRLARVAGLFCEFAGDFPRAASYYEEAIATDSPDPITVVALADVYFRLGRLDGARACLARAEFVAQSTGDDDAAELVAAARARMGSDR